MENHKTSADPDNPPPPLIVRILDRVVISIIKMFIVLAMFRSRDPRIRTSNLLKPGFEQQTQIRNWQAVLAWPPGKRVGCFLGVLIGIAIGGFILWYGLQ